MSPTDHTDGDWVRERFADVVPAPPPAPDRLEQLRARRRVVRRRRAAGVAVVSSLVVAAIAVMPQVLGQQMTGRPVPTGVHTPTPSPSPTLECPSPRHLTQDRGAATLAPGATSARLCGSTAPQELVTTGVARIVRAVNSQPKGYQDCGGPPGAVFVLMLGYPDGSTRRVGLNFSGCGFLLVGRHNRVDPRPAYEAFLSAVRRQRVESTPPGDVPAPTCMQQYAAYSPLARPVDMVAARMCVTYADNGRTTSTPVSSEDLRTILRSWATGPTTPDAKTDLCPQTTPTWVLSGVTRWGDPVQITAECQRVSHGSDWVELSPRAKAVVDRLVTRAGVEVDDGSRASTAWMLAQAWITDVNARAIAPDPRIKAAIAKVADGLWVRDPWLPEGAADWYLLGATRTSAPGWAEAWRIPARTPEGEAVFVVVRNAKDEPWRILNLTR
jgi:hypothetical protein